MWRLLKQTSECGGFCSYYYGVVIEKYRFESIELVWSVLP
jgi:hypothetical protein